MLYIRVKDTNVVYGFSDIFEVPKNGDICIDESTTRHFQINGEINPPLCNGEGTYLYKYIDGVIIKKTEEEIATEKPVPVVIFDEKQAQIDTLFASIDNLMLEIIPTLMG